MLSPVSNVDCLKIRILVTSYADTSGSDGTKNHNSSSTIDVPAVAHADCTKKLVPEQWHHVPNHFSNNYQSDFCTMEDASKETQMNTEKLSVSEAHSKNQRKDPNKSIATSEEQCKSETEPTVMLYKLNMQDQFLSHKSIKVSTIKSKCAGDVKEKRCLADPVVLLTKLNTEELLLAQESINKFMLKYETKAAKLPVYHGTSEIKSCQVSLSGRKSYVTDKIRKKYRNNVHHPVENNSEIIENKSIKRKISASEGEVINHSSLLHERIKRKRCPVSRETNCNELSLSKIENDPVFLTLKVKKFKKAKKRLINKTLSTEDLIKTNTWQYFSDTVDKIFSSVEDIDLFAVTDEDAKCPEEILISIDQLRDLSRGAAKLKYLQAMNQFQPEYLIHLLVLLEKNVTDGAKLLILQFLEEQDEETQLYLELSKEKLMRSVHASLTALYILTSPKMPAEIFLENTIERIVMFLKYQLQNTVFPLFDPSYGFDTKSTESYIGNTKQKGNHKKIVLPLYNKLLEVVSLLAELLDLQTLTDTVILDISSLGLSSFFVESVNELQLISLRLISTIFSHYDEHRLFILQDILASIVKLPTSKRNLRNYRLNSEENIQMLTALVLQLIHSVIQLPESETDEKLEYSSNKIKSNGKHKSHLDKDFIIITSYEASIKTAINFLSFFLKKCSTKNKETDYRSLFDNFVQDLLITANRPEWPASELLLSILGRILMKNFSNKSMEMTVRIASLDYLGIIAAHLRKNDIISREHTAIINDIIQRVTVESDSELSPLKEKKQNQEKSIKCNEVQVLQKLLLYYLDSSMKSDPAYQFYRRFYIAQWYNDTSLAAEIKYSNKSLNLLKEESEKSGKIIPNKNEPDKSREYYNNKSQMPFKDKKKDINQGKESKLQNDEITDQVTALSEERKNFFLAIIEKQDKLNMKVEKHIDYKTAKLISQMLTSKQHFSKCFDLYLSQILQGLSETAVGIRSKAMKCLTLVVEVDPSILTRLDMQKAVHGRLLDCSTSVREATVDLLGKFILINPELINHYYDMLTDRILDTGISVRKRVIKILRNICLEQPSFSRIPEICVKMIQCVNDEDGVKKLVEEIFQNMWFEPISDKKPEKLLQKVNNIMCVVKACRHNEFEWFKQLLSNLLKNKACNNYKSVIKSSQQIVDCVVENLLKLEESSQNIDGKASPHLLVCLTTLYLFCKVHPPFVVPHATVIQPYLSMKCTIHSDFLFLKNVVQILELVIPLMKYPSELFLTQTEEEIVKLIFCQHVSLLKSCISCLEVVNKVTHNYQLVKDCFQKFFIILLGYRKEFEKSPESGALKSLRPKLLRSLYTVGLFSRYFDIEAMNVSSEPNIQISHKDRILKCIIYFSQHDDENICLKALMGLGFFMIQHSEFMLSNEVKTLYHYLLTSPVASSTLKCQILKNISNYLIEEEVQMIEKEAEWIKTSKKEDLKEMNDVTSGMSSTIIQIYLKQILECVLHTELAVRKASLQVIHLIFKQGLIHPVQIIPHLICLSSDDNLEIRYTADKLLQENEKKYPGFTQMKAVMGMRISFKMQQLVHNQKFLRGFRELETPVSRNAFLYSVLRSNRQNRRAFILSLLKLFDEQSRTPLTELLYIADNIAYFPYKTQDEPLFIMYHSDIMLSISGSNLLQTFQEALLNRQKPQSIEQNPMNPEVDDCDEDDFDTILERLPEDISILRECIAASQGCKLLLYLKQTLKEMYCFTDDKIQQYSPNEATIVYEKSLNRKLHVQFHPETVINFILNEDLKDKLDAERRELTQQYVHFKQLMLKIDPINYGDDSNEAEYVAACSAAKESNNNENQGQPVLKKITFSQNKRFSHNRSKRKSFKADGKKVKKGKKRKRIITSDLDDSSSDPDYVV
ncbi:nipped-B-like protein isoform X2 [Stegodyphus dumicola]|uniref:nipped-B-like protein isoform X2 n=1 Tax=Stegodyphus dumicola TaxID=202533 RepID=UPI0015B35F92|nr:nipped-B-like protein isoform X2 [Stegodyphus dumicola]